MMEGSLERRDEPEDSQTSVSWWQRSLVLAGQLFVGFDVFISYSRSDASEKAVALRDALKARGLSVFVDTGELEAGAELSPRLERAARSSSVLAVLVTAGAIARPRWITAEVRASATSWLRSSIVAIVDRPLTPGNVPAPLDSLNRFRSLDADDDNAALAEELLRTSVRRRLRRRRALAFTMFMAVIGLAFYLQQARAESTRRSLVVAKWMASAERSALRGRYDLAEYAVAKALEADPSSRERLTERYRTYREHRLVVPGTTIELAPAERILAVAAFGAVVGADKSVRLVEPSNPSSSRPLDCPDVGRALDCGGTVTLFCKDSALTLSDGPERSTPLRGSVRDVACVAGKARALLEDDARQLSILDLETNAREPVLGARNWTSARLCERDHRAIGAWMEKGHLSIARDDTNESRIGPEALTATVVADPSCEHLVIDYSATTPGAGPLGPSTEHRLILEWALGVQRSLPAIRSWKSLPAESGYLGVYLSSSGELALVPLADAVVLELRPTVVATDVSAFAVWDPTSVRTVTIEGTDLVIRDRGELITRRPMKIEGATRVIVSDEIIVVEGSSSAMLWRKAAPSSNTVPTSEFLERELALTKDEIMVDPQTLPSPPP